MSDDHLDLTVPSGSTLPKRCAKCGVREELEQRSQTFRWTPTWAVPLVWIPSARRLWVRTATLRFYICPSCGQRWAGGTALHVVALALVASLFVLNHYLGQPALFFALFPVVAVAALYMTRAAARTRQIYPQHIDFDQKILTLGGVHPEVVAKWRARAERAAARTETRARPTAKRRLT